MENEYDLNSIKKLLDEAKNYQLDNREKNFFETGARGHYENPTTDVLAFFLRPNEPHNLSHIFMEALASCFNLSSDPINFGEVISVKREVAVLNETNTNARIDLFIETTTTLYVIECKIYHHQYGNPFALYKNYAQEFTTSKKVVCGVLCINGESKAEGWYGLSYRKLAQELKLYLTQVSFDQPLNKWMIFAREFILLLESYYQMNINKHNLKFILEHAQDIEKLIALREETFNSLPKYLGHEIHSNIGENFIYKESDEHRTNVKEFWFTNDKLAPENWSAATLEIANFNSTPSFQINIYLLVESNCDEQALKTMFPRYDFASQQKEYQWGNKKYLKGYYSLAKLDIKEVTDLCIEATKTISEIYVKNAKTSQST